MVSNTAMRVMPRSDHGMTPTIIVMKATKNVTRMALCRPVSVPPPPAPTRLVKVIPRPGKAQTDIAYGFTTVRRLDPRYYAFTMMNNILGQFGLGGRLAENIRERQGMAYYAYSTLEGMPSESSLIVRAGVDPQNLGRTLDAIDAEVGALGASGPTPEEFSDTRTSLIGSIPRLFESNESIAEFLQTVEQYDLGLDFDRRLPDLLGEVSLEQVREAAREVLRPNTRPSRLPALMLPARSSSIL